MIKNPDNVAEIIFINVMLVLTSLYMAGILLFPVTAPGIHAMLDNLFTLTCHRLPDRCTLLNMYHCPICVRCLGIAVGCWIAALISFLGLNRPFRLKSLMTAFLIAMTINFAEWTMEKTGLIGDHYGILRLITGLWLGFCFILLYDFYMKRLFRSRLPVLAVRHVLNTIMPGK